MATGLELKSAWGFKQRGIRAFANMSTYTILRQEIDHPYCRPWMWDNFYFGTDYGGSSLGISVSDTLSSAAGGLAVGSILLNVESGDPYVYIGDPLILEI